MKLKLKEGILIQEVAGEKILMASGMEEVDDCIESVCCVIGRSVD
mgnify:CR=1 FL=1